MVQEIQEEHGGSDEKPLAAGGAMAVDTAVSSKPERILLESGIEDREERKPRVFTTLISGTHPVQRKSSINRLKHAADATISTKQKRVLSEVGVKDREVKKPRLELSNESALESLGDLNVGMREDEEGKETGRNAGGDAVSDFARAMFRSICSGAGCGELF